MQELEKPKKILSIKYSKYFKRKTYGSLSELKQAITLILNNNKYLTKSELFLMSPMFCRNLLGIRLVDLIDWRNGDEEHKAMYEYYKDLEDFLCANITQDMIERPMLANYRLSILKVCSEEFKNADTSEAANKVETKIEIKMNSRKATNKLGGKYARELLSGDD